tara:strand:+ start:591 stop:1283 length:693 start_codon:yes stop_codon:yes gene_type:complete
MIIKVKNFINSILFKLGYRFSKINNSHELFKIYKYNSYDDYKKTQIFYNKKKINHIWADEENLVKICNFIKKNISRERIKGICHGSRNGFEQKIIQKNINNSEVIGTDISDNATKFENTFVWDFHKEKKEWINFFDFVYTNSLDQSYDPKKALEVWFNQINTNGYIIIEHSEQHGVRASNKMDPFGVEANFFPYLLSDWFGHKVSISIIKSIKKNKSNAPVWFFVLKKID